VRTRRAAQLASVTEQWSQYSIAGPESQRAGARVRVHDPIRNSDLQADIVHPVFFDPEGTRFKA
jgi:glycine cleavage system aminomethyltransferase T